MSCVKRNDLNRYYSRLKRIASDNLGERVVDLLVNEGAKEARTQYAGTHFEVTSEQDGQNGTVIASGMGIAYVEYGTGLIGKGTYEGELPTQTLTFESPKQSGKMHTTQGWQYFYDNPQTKVQELGGWFFGKGYKNFTKGRVAGMQMFNTAKSLREYVRNGSLAQDIRSK